MKIVKFDDFMKLANFFYATIGIQPYEKHIYSKGQIFLSNLIFYLGIINMNIMLCSELTFVGLTFINGRSLLEANMTMSYIGFILVGDFKMFFVWRQKLALTKFVNGLQKMFPENAEKQQQYNIPYYLKQCNRTTMSFSLLYMILIWTYNLFGAIQYLIYDKWLNLRVVEKTLPYLMYIPWKWQDHWSYYLVYFFQDFAGYTAAAGQIASDLFLTTCTTQIIMHFDYVAKIINNYKVELGQTEIEKDKTFVKNMHFLKNIINYHDYLLDLCEQVNKVVGLPLLLNFITSSFVICFVGFQITIGAPPETIFKLGVFLFSSIAQVYLICHYSQLLIDASTNVSNAVYNQNWPIADVRYQKMLILIAQRAQKPAQLKATTFVLISRATMTEIMQLSYKFFALLRTMYG